MLVISGTRTGMAEIKMAKDVLNAYSLLDTESSLKARIIRKLPRMWLRPSNWRSQSRNCTYLQLPGFWVMWASRLEMGWRPDRKTRTVHVQAPRWTGWVIRKSRRWQVRRVEGLGQPTGTIFHVQLAKTSKEESVAFVFFYIRQGRVVVRQEWAMPSPASDCRNVGDNWAASHAEAHTTTGLGHWSLSDEEAIPKALSAENLAPDEWKWPSVVNVFRFWMP